MVDRKNQPHYPVVNAGFIDPNDAPVITTIDVPEVDGRYPEPGLKAFESPTSCTPANCEIKQSRRKWEGNDLQECPRCGYTTLDREEAKRRNPALR